MLSGHLSSLGWGANKRARASGQHNERINTGIVAAEEVWDTNTVVRVPRQAVRLHSDGRQLAPVCGSVAQAGPTVGGNFTQTGTCAGGRHSNSHRRMATHRAPRARASSLDSVPEVRTPRRRSTTNIQKKWRRNAVSQVCRRVNKRNEAPPHPDRVGEADAAPNLQPVRAQLLDLI